VRRNDFCQKKCNFFSQFAKISINKQNRKRNRKDLLKISLKPKKKKKTLKSIINVYVGFGVELWSPVWSRVLCVCFVPSGEKKWGLLGLFLMSRFGHEIRRVPRPLCLVSSALLFFFFLLLSLPPPPPSPLPWITCTPALHNSAKRQPKRRKKPEKTILLVAAGTASYLVLFSRIPDVRDLTLSEKLF